MMETLPQFDLLPCPPWQDYDLLDSGNGQRLERFGPYHMIRPDAEAVWKPALPDKDWAKAEAFFRPSPEENGGHWEFRRPLPERWQMNYNGLRFWAQTGGSKQLGIFPEQSSQWDWVEEQIKTAHRPLTVLNLFGYTGLASLAAARAGARVTHLDASKKVVGWAKENQSISGLENRPIRWIVDDAVKFVEREGRRGAGYDGIILDPPKFGRGPKGEVWEFYKLLPNLLEDCRKILSQEPQFVVLTAYAVKASALTLHYALQEVLKDQPGTIQIGEVALREQSAGRLLSTAIYARWSRNAPASMPG